VTVALVRGLVEWIPQSATWVGILAGPLVLVGYIVGSLPFDRFAPRHGPEVRTDATAVALAVGATLLVTTLAWDLALAAAPNATFSAVGFYANQIIPAWASVALWTGMGAVLGHMAPVFRSFRDGGSGIAPAVALAAAHTPLVLVVGLAVYLLARTIGAGDRTAVLAALPAAVTYEYLAWTADWQAGWGLTNGPEVALWVAALAVALAARNAQVGA
jgi:glycerol-3-phosphate acyltransferase PlsY